MLIARSFVGNSYLVGNMPKKSLQVLKAFRHKGLIMVILTLPLLSQQGVLHSKGFVNIETTFLSVSNGVIKACNSCHNNRRIQPFKAEVHETAVNFDEEQLSPEARNR
jgi:hypothetical protein